MNEQELNEELEKLGSCRKQHNQAQNHVETRSELSE